MLALFFAASPDKGWAQASCPAGLQSPAVFIDSAASDVVIIRAGGVQVLAVRDLLLCPGDEVLTGATGRVAIRFDAKRTIIRLDGNSRTRILQGDAPASAETATPISVGGSTQAGAAGADVSLISGVLYFLSSVRTRFEVDTPYIVAGIDGTEALVGVRPAEALAIAAVREGLVGAYDKTSPRPPVQVAEGEAAFRSAAVPFQKAPISELPPPFRDLLIVSASSVDWAVYYPPIMLAEEAGDARLGRAIELLSSGEYDRAAAELDAARDAEPATSAALRTIIEIGRNRLAEAARAAEAALAADPDSARAHVAASYARQASGDLAGALAYARVAARLAPDDAYVLARLAELQLTVGDRRGALATAERSLAIRRTPLALFAAGLAELAASRYQRAEAHFREAIALDPEAPLARLGLGLLFIRRGDTAAGTWEIERALAHDPRRAALRNWLGRAYFDEGLTDKAAEQFRLAKDEDPQDPTPHLFSAVERYAANRPIEALRDLYAAEERARERDVLRSERGLAEDAATLGAALGRIYDVLGFEQLAIVEGAEAVDADPSNPGAHRFLAEAYRSRDAVEIAKTSELLRSQLLSPPSKTPVQPQLAESDLSLLDTSGPAHVTFAEFSPLFDADGLRFDAQGLFGSQNTYGGEASATALARNFSLSVGQFHYQTDGFQKNNDVEHDIWNAVTTLSVSPWLDLFGEFRARRTTAGDRSVFFDPETQLSETLRINFDREVYRAGFHAMPSIDHHLLGLLSYGSLETASSERAGISRVARTRTEERILEGQAQYVGSFLRADLQIGASLSRVEGEEAGGVVLPGQPLAENPVDASQGNAYVYTTFRLPDAFLWTFGLSGDNVDEGDLYRRSGFNPKVGVRVFLGENITIRGAYFSTLKRRAVADQTLEPTTIAGFAQFFDALNGTTTDRAGVGLDVRLSRAASIGGEATLGQLDVAGSSGGKIDETRVAGYLNMTLGENLAVAISPSWDKSESDPLFAISKINTLEVPVSISYFSDTGLFAAARATYVSQQGTDADLLEFEDEFIVVDASIGYRFADQRGLVNLEVLNLFDSDFGYVEQTLVPDLTSDPRFARERSIIGRLSLRF